MVTYKILPAIIANDQEELDRMIYEVADYADTVMLDFMDGEFVANRSLDFDFELPCDLHYQAHLMVDEPYYKIIEIQDKIQSVIVHYETERSSIGAIRMAQQRKLETWVAINPDTSLDRIRHHLTTIDGVLVMTVVPGKYGSEFLPETLDKVREIRDFQSGLNIGVDGGINDKTIRAAKEAGANYFSSGSYILKNDDPKRAYNRLSELIV